MKLKKVFKYLIIILICALCIGGIGWGLSKYCANKNENVTTKKTKEIHYQKLNLVCVGDSLTYGEQDPTHKGGYVYLVKQKLEQHYDLKVSTYNYGKTGDRTDQIEKRIKNNSDIQNHLKKADVITMSFGGNDLIQALQKHFNVLMDNQLSKIMPQQEKKYANNINSLLQCIRKYNMHAPIFIFSIYNPFYVYFPTVSALQKYTNQWVEVTKNAIKDVPKTYLVNVNNRLSQGQYLNHDQTKLKQDSKMNLENLSSAEIQNKLNDKHELNDYLSANDHFHPNLKGYQYMANQLYQKMMQHKNLWLNSQTTKR